MKTTSRANLYLPIAAMMALVGQLAGDGLGSEGVIPRDQERFDAGPLAGLDGARGLGVARQRSVEAGLDLLALVEHVGHVAHRVGDRRGRGALGRREAQELSDEEGVAAGALAQQFRGQMTDLAAQIEAAFEARDTVTPASADVRAIVDQALDLLDSGAARVAEPDGEGGWKVNQWLKKAVLDRKSVV